MIELGKFTIPPGSERYHHFIYNTYRAAGQIYKYYPDPINFDFKSDFYNLYLNLFISLLYSQPLYVP